MTSFMARDLRSKVLTWWISGDSTQITIFLSTDSIITIFNVTYSVLYTSIMLTYFYHNDPYFDVMGLVKPCEKSVPQFFYCFYVTFLLDVLPRPAIASCTLARSYFSVPFDSDQSPIRHDMVKRKLQVNTAEPTQHKPAPTSRIATSAASSLKAKV